MKKFCTSLREHAKDMTDFKKKKMLPLTKKTIEITSRHFWKVRDHCHYTGKYRGAANSICNLEFKVPNEIPVVFHNGSNYGYLFIIKDLAK